MHLTPGTLNKFNSTNIFFVINLLLFQCFQGTCHFYTKFTCSSKPVYIWQKGNDLQTEWCSTISQMLIKWTDHSLCQTHSDNQNVNSQPFNHKLSALPLWDWCRYCFASLALVSTLSNNSCDHVNWWHISVLCGNSAWRVVFHCLFYFFDLFSKHLHKNVSNKNKSNQLTRCH